MPRKTAAVVPAEPVAAPAVAAAPTRAALEAELGAALRNGNVARASQIRASLAKSKAAAK